MRRYFRPLWLCAALALQAQTPQPEPAILQALAAHEYNLASDGRDFLLAEARNSNYFLLGELHGENEIPALLHAIWPAMWKDGYRHVAAEISPWAADQLQTVSAGKGPAIQGLWTRSQADDVRSVAPHGAQVVWGCDMEEVRVESLIRELARVNPADPVLAQMVQLTKDKYVRAMAPALLEMARRAKDQKDERLNGLSLRQSLLATLNVESNRIGPDTRMIAQNARELLMKQQLLAHMEGATGKVLLRFGRNHLHRGYDARGISTLGNFVAEFATAHGQKVFNVGAFAAGGKETLLGNTFDADERTDELTFALLADQAKYPATLYDLRPLRSLLHRIPQEKRSALETNLIYWSDAYDALLCYKVVTPLQF